MGWGARSVVCTSEPYPTALCCVFWRTGMPFNITYFQECSRKHFLIVQKLCNTKSLNFRRQRHPCCTLRWLEQRSSLLTSQGTAGGNRSCRYSVLTYLSKYFFKLIHLLESWKDSWPEFSHWNTGILKSSIKFVVTTPPSKGNFLFRDHSWSTQSNLSCCEMIVCENVDFSAAQITTFIWSVNT